jgi:hypothetical protein
MPFRVGDVEQRLIDDRQVGRVGLAQKPVGDEVFVFCA